ncbi:MAG: FtsX-like permease family protein [Vicinamibacterales bacterium]
MRLLLLISWPYFRKHLLRTLLTAAGILLGISVFVAMQAANQSALLAFSQTIDRLAGKTDLQVTAGEAGFGEDILEKVQSEPSVSVAVPVIEAVVETSLAEGGSLLILGVDMTGDRSLRDYDVEGDGGAEIDDPLVFLAQPDSIMLSKEFAAAAHLSTGDRITLGTAEGDRQFTVRGLMATRGMMSAFGGKLAVMDIYAAQKMFGRGRTFDRIDVGLKPDAPKDAGRQALQQLLGPGFDVQTPASRGQQAEAVLAGYTIMVRIASAFALFIAMFIIYNAFSTAVAQRRSEIGVLRALGASRYQIAGLFVMESAVIGMLGAAAGIGLGVVVARGVALLVGSLVGSLYGVAQQAEDVATSTGTLYLAFGLGLGTSVVAAVGPAFAAASVSPLEALRRGSFQQLTLRAHLQRLGFAALLGTAAAGCLLSHGSRQIAYLGYGLTIAAAVAGTPALSLGLAKAFRPLASLLRPVEGALAADSLVQSPKRTAASVSALMLSLTLIIAFAGVARSSYASIVEWMDAALNPDLFVMPSQRLDIRTTRFPASMARDLASVPGVEQVQMFRNNRITFRGSPAMIVAVEMGSVARTARRKTIAGDPDSMYAIAAQGRGAIVSDNLATLHHLAIGHDVEVAAPYGQLRLPVVGIVVDYTDQQGSILIDRSLFLKYWQDDTVSDFRVYIHKDADSDLVRKAIVERFAGRRKVFVLANADARAYVLGLTGDWFRLMNVQVAVAILVAILGIVNTLTVSVADRKRDLGVMRAVGALGEQVQRTIRLEALGIAGVAIVLGYALGGVCLFYMLQVVQQDVAGLRLDYLYPFTTAAWLAPVILVAAYLAALGPARSAVRVPLSEALEYE